MGRVVEVLGRGWVVRGMRLWIVQWSSDGSGRARERVKIG